MFKTYLKLAFRNLWKRKTTTAINVLGLAVGLACCALVFLFFQHELSFDKGFANGDRIYRVVSDFNFSGETYHNSGVMLPMANAVCSIS